MYYLEGRMLVNPKIIHFTLGPLKPWVWWTYPFLDLNWKWNDFRGSHMTKYNLPYMSTLQWIFQLCVLAAPSLLKRYVIMKQGEILKRPTYVGDDFRRLGLGILGLSMFVAFITNPSHLYPSMAWFLFFVKFLYYDMSLVQAYSIAFIGRPVTKWEQFKFLCILFPFSILFWFLLYAISPPHPRFIVFVFGASFWVWTVTVRNHRMLTYYEYGKREIRYHQVERVLSNRKYED
ncbi:hypothetical protein L596_014673 [Steinernema carpocapsae]|uniref:Uncharacterized protein n=1 Tax=Steinernema carpocapsae TaxID=34508 RepID=A0A4U5NDF3_STECR|nr:hypothetical protein L596_014673 [Steinernema carpocapsae]